MNKNTFRFRKRYHLVIFLILFCNILTGCQSNKKVEDTIEKIYTFDVKNPNKEFDIPNNIVVDGVEYELVDLKQIVYGSKDMVEIIDSVTIPQGETIQSEKEVLIDQDEHVFYLGENNTTLEETRIRIVKKIEFNEMLSSFSFESAPKYIPLIVWQNGNKVELKAELNSLKKVSNDKWIDDLIIEASFKGDEDTEYFNTGYSEIKIDSEFPIWKDYQSQILKSNNLNSKYYRIDTGNWVGEYHKDSNNKWVRKAIYNGGRKIANYVGEYVLEYDTKANVGELIYYCDDYFDESIEKVTVYKVECKTKYKLVESVN